MRLKQSPEQCHADARAGFTLVDVAVAIPSAAILVTIVSILLVSMVTQYRRVEAAVELQRDAQVIVTALRHAVRHANEADVSVNSGVLSIQRGARTASFQRTIGSDFEYDPNTEQSGDSITYAAGSVTAFTVTKTSIGISVDMSMQNSEASTRLETTIAFRN